LKERLIKMPVENLEHEGLAKNPNLELAQLKFFLTLDQHKNDATAKQQLMDAIRADGNVFISYLFFHCAIFLIKLFYVQIWLPFMKKFAKNLVGQLIQPCLLA
jgi:hypothetical protein